jgi:hypothetical protein
MFQVAGLLQPHAGGPPIWPELSVEAMSANPTLLDKGEYDKGKGWYTSPAGADHVRSLYLVQKRSVRLPLLESFDPPDLYVPCGRRESSTTSPQALTLLNSDVTEKVVAAFAERVTNSAGDEKQHQITTASRYALQREPTPAELDLYSGLYDEAGLVAVCRVLVNSSEFLYTD